VVCRDTRTREIPRNPSKNVAKDEEPRPRAIVSMRAPPPAMHEFDEVAYESDERVRVRGQRTTAAPRRRNARESARCE
jgi:hypothetical protein